MENKWLNKFFNHELILTLSFNRTREYPCHICSKIEVFTQQKRCRQDEIQTHTKFLLFPSTEKKVTKVEILMEKEDKINLKRKCSNKNIVNFS